MTACGDEIVITDARLGPANIFGGYIKDITYKFLTNSVYVQVCKCQDYTKLITDVSSGVTADYSAGANTEKEILTALFAAHCATITVGASVIAGALAAIKFTDSSLIRAIDELAAISDRKWYVDYDKALHYFVSGDEAATFDLSDSPDDSATFGYAKLEYTIDEDSLERATLVCWQPGLFAGQTIGITNSTLSWADKQFLITNVITKLKGAPSTAAYALEYSVTLGTIPKQRFTNEIIRSGRVVTTARIADLAVTDAKIENLTASKITAGNLTVAVLVDTGGVLQTAASGARVTIAPTGIKWYDATTQRGQILNDGSGWLGASGAFSWTTAGVVTMAAANVSGALTAATISVTALTAGNLTVAGTITTGSIQTGAAGSNRIVIDKDYITGYNAANVKQFYLSAADGKAYCAAGKVILDSAGVYIEGTSDTLLKFKAAAADTYYQAIASLGDGILGLAAQEIQIRTDFSWAAAAEQRIRIGVAAANYIEITEAYVGLKTYGVLASALIQAQGGITTTGDIDPSADVTYELGNASYSYKSVYAKNHVIDGGAAEAITGNLWYDPTGPKLGVYTGGQFWYITLTNTA